MYGKIFASMFKGSLYGQWEAIITFTCMIVLADQHGEVDMTPEALSAQTSIPLDIIKRGIASLEMPDPKSRTPDEEGRRIVRVSDSRDWGWMITNHSHYRAMRTAEERREYFKEHKRKARAKVCPPVSTESPQSPPIAVSSKQEAVKTTTLSKKPDLDDPRFTQFWSTYPRRAGSSKAASLTAWGKRLREGADPEAILDGTARYAAYVEKGGAVGPYVKMAQTFLGPDRHWESDWTPAPEPIDAAMESLLAEARNPMGRA